MAEFRLGPVCDVAFRGRDVPPKCFLVSPGLGDGFQRLRCWARHWRYRGHDGTYPSIFDAGFGIGFGISALIAPIPFFGLISWLVGQLIGWTASNFLRKATERS